MIVFFENSKNMGWSTDNILTIINIFVLLLTLYFTYRSSDKKIKADLVCVLQDFPTQYCKEKVHTFAPEIFL